MKTAAEIRRHADDARHLTRVVAAVVIFLSLFACDALFHGVFPAELAQVTAQADLSRKIAASDATGFSLCIARSGGQEFVLLFSGGSFDASRDHVIVLSPDLKILNEYTMNDITAVTAGVLLSGTGAVTHLLDGHVVIGNLDAMPGGGGLQLLGLLAANAQVDGWTFVGPSSAPVTWTGFRMSDPQTVSWSVYPGAWAAPTSVSVPLGRSAQICGAFSDPQSSAHNSATLVFSYGGSGDLSFFQVPKDPDLVNGLFGPPLFDNPAYTPFTKSGLSSRDVYTTNDSIIGYDEDAHSWVRFTPSDPGSESRLRTAKRSDGLKSAFSFSGGYYCTWDPGTQILTRMDDWW